MTIDRIGSIDPLSSYNKTSKTNKVSPKQKTDSISLSQEARSKAEVFKMSEAVKNTPEIREDRVAEVREKLKDPSYIDSRVIESVADDIMDVFGL